MKANSLNAAELGRLAAEMRVVLETQRGLERETEIQKQMSDLEMIRDEAEEFRIGLRSTTAAKPPPTCQLRGNDDDP